MSSSNSDSISATECVSNSTHIAWYTTNDDGCIYQTWSEAVKECSHWLRQNLMPFDIPNAGTLGFPPENKKKKEATTTLQRKAQEEEEEEDDSLPDGLSDGIVNQTIYLALQTKVDYYPWTSHIPREIFNDYVLNFVSTNEARTNWRPLLLQAIQPTLRRILATGDSSKQRIEDVVKAINQDLWLALGKFDPAANTTQPIYFKAGQTPLIFDPMSVIAYGYASCTGMSILLVCALRAAGIPARLAGTPAWNGDVNNGNHNWVEVWTPSLPATDDGAAAADDAGDGIWRFLEPAYGDFGDNVDNLERDPCSRWFCNTKHFDGTTKVYAARYDRSDISAVYYPLAWDSTNHDVPGVDQSEYYTEIAKKCQ